MTFLISSWVIAIVAAKKAVTPPTNVINTKVVLANSNSGEQRIIKKTPAVTNAETKCWFLIWQTLKCDKNPYK